MAILVTGGAGYIGSITVEHLRSHGEKVVVIDNLSRGHRASVEEDVPFYQGDVGDAVLIERITQEHEIESCVHFAAFAYVNESVQEPRMYWENNLVQGLNLLAALLETGLRRFVFSSSCATYGDPDTVPVNEETPQKPASPYGWSKLLLERALVSYSLAYGLQFVGLRYFNAAGATETHGEHHDPETHLIPNVLLAASGKHSEVSVFGDDYATPDGTTIRDYVHVSDLAAAHASALTYLRENGRPDFFNVGSGRGYSVREVIDCARKVTGKEIHPRIQPRRPGDAARLFADISKIRQSLRWSPRQSDLATIVASAWRWQGRHNEAK